MSVTIAPHTPAWAAMAQAEGMRWRRGLGSLLVTLHHIGSTAVPTLAARPVVDLMPVFAPDAGEASLRIAIEALGYEWCGNAATPYLFQFAHPETGALRFHARGYLRGDPEIRRPLAFRDALLADPLLASAYEGRKRHCAFLHPNDHAAYAAAKASWIDTVEARALNSRRQIA